MARQVKKTNPMLISLIQDLKKKAYENDAPIWKDIARRLEKPSSTWPVVNLNRIDTYFNEKETGYEKGRTSFHDLLEAQSDLAVSKLERIRARFQIKLSAARLLEVTGFWAVWPREKDTTVAGVPALKADEM